MADHGRTGGTIARGVLLALFPALLYANTLRSSFHYDDQALILNNHYVHSLSSIPHFFVSSRLISNIALSGYRPLTMTSFALNYAVGGTNPIGYHAVNVACHVLSTLLAYAVALALLRALAVPRSRSAAMAVALLFAAHPINTQPVNYISGRSTLLVGCFSLLCFLLYLRSHVAAHGLRRNLLRVCALGAYACALLSKEEAVAVPCLLGAYEICRHRLDMKRVREIVVSLLPFAILTVVFIAIVISVLGVVGDTDQPRGIGENLMTQAHVFFLYVKMLLFPTRLSIDHVVGVSTSLLEPATLIATVGLIVLATGSLLLLRIAPVVPFGIWWMLFALAPSSTLVTLKLVLNEQRLYLAAIGLFFLAGALFATVLERAAGSRTGTRRVLSFGFVVVLATLAALTVHRNTQWRTPFSLWSSALDEYPDSARANTQLVSHYLLMGRPEKALELARKAVELAPDRVETHLALATACSQTGLLEEALIEARAAVDMNPGRADAQLALGTVYARLGRYREAESAWKTALDLDPQIDEARENLQKLKDLQESEKASGR
jgi:Flp pilus assembly protein TadD